MTDRHYALFANNQHPLQLATYEEYNRFLRSVHSAEQQQQRTEFGERLGQVLEERQSLLNTSEGESLSFDDITDIYCQVGGEQRNKNNMSLNTRSKNGDISDYLEVRRPFGAAE